MTLASFKLGASLQRDLVVMTRAHGSSDKAIDQVHRIALFVANLPIA